MTHVAEVVGAQLGASVKPKQRSEAEAVEGREGLWKGLVFCRGSASCVFLLIVFMCFSYGCIVLFWWGGHLFLKFGTNYR